MDIELLKKQKRDILHTISELENIYETRDVNKAWTRDELSKVAPYYHGATGKFSLRMYIDRLRNKNLKEVEDKIQNQQTSKTSYQYAEVRMTLQMATIQLFHASCTNYRFYMGVDQPFDQKKFESDLTIWITHIATIWESMIDTRHEEECSCCLSFSALATNWEHLFRETLSESLLQDKRVNTEEIIRWAEKISTEGAKEAFESIRQMAIALIEDRDHPRISDVTTDSSAMSDAEGESFKVSTRVVETSEDSEDASCNQEEVSEPKQVRRIMRKRKTMPRPLDKVEEIPNADRDEITLVHTGIKRAFHISVKTSSPCERDFLAGYARVFLKYLVIVHTFMTRFRIMPSRYKHTQYAKHSKRTTKLKATLRYNLEGVRSKYTTRSRKRKKEEMCTD